MKYVSTSACVARPVILDSIREIPTVINEAIQTQVGEYVRVWMRSVLVRT